MRPTYSLLPEYRDRTSLDDTPWQQASSNEKYAEKRQNWLKVALLISFMTNIALFLALSSENIGCSTIATVLDNTHSEPGLVSGHSNSGHDSTSKLDAEDYPATKFAGLKRNIPMQWTYNAPTTEEAWVKLWNSSPFYAGIISLPDTYALEMGLPRAQRWPWSREKGIYVLNSFHNFHCVMNIKQSLEEFRGGLSQSVEWPHIQHCLLVLRDEIMCNADDTPRYTGYQNWGSSGYGQERMCRNWTQLEEWAMDPQREGCWRNLPGVLGDKRNDTSNHLLERYRFCSDLNPHKKESETMWRDPSVWED